MSGTATGSIKSAATNKERHGSDFYRRIGAEGGRVKNPRKGFGSKTLLERMLRMKSRRAKKYGKVGGTISRRGKANG